MGRPQPLVPVILHSLFDVFRAIQFFLYGNDLPT